MMDLNEPLGMRARRPRRRYGVAVGIAFGVLAVGGTAAFFALSEPGGEPGAVALIPKPPAVPPPAVADPMPTGSLSAQPKAQADTGLPMTDSVENGIKVYRGTAPQRETSRQADRGPLVIDVTKSLDAPPRKASKTPDIVTGAGSAPPAKPRIALFVSGMGLGTAATRSAIELMPPAIDLAFVPYGATIQASVDAAKAKGHEILLQVPMQTGPTGGAPGPHALRPDEPKSALLEDIAWITGQLHGYAGFVNLLGEPVTADKEVMTALLQKVAADRRFFVDDGTSKRSVAANLGPGLGTPVLKSDLVIDATSDPSVVRTNLDKLVALARKNGVAIGMASGLPDHMSEIARFAGDLQGKGVELVPLGALAGRDANLATAR